MSDWLDHYEKFVNVHHSFGPSTSTSRKEPLRVKEIPSNNDNFGWDDREEEDKTIAEISDEDNNLEQRFALLENKEDNKDTDDKGKENKNTAEISSENEEDNEEENVDMFKKPMCEGWERECIVREGEISQVYYLSPIMAAMECVETV